MADNKPVSLGIITVPKKGTGVEGDEIRPDTTEKWWERVAERATEFDIEVFQYPSGGET